MKKLFNDNWTFKKIPYQDNYDYDKARTLSGLSLVALPHDWLIYNCENLYEDGIGVYQKTFEISQVENKHYEIYFEGVYMDSSVYLNGVHLGDWKYGYSSFYFSMDEAVKKGDNELTVIVRHKAPNSRWYSGAGIYRSVYLIEQDTAYFETDSFYITPVPKDDVYDLKVEADILGEISDSYEVAITLTDKSEVISFQSSWAVADVVENGHISAMLSNLKVESWSAETPNLYNIKVDLLLDDETLDSYSTRIGFKSVKFDSNKGMFVNGRHVKLHGVCLHHDLGCLGAAFNKAAARRQLEIMKDMGCNAIRTAHNMPSPEFMDLCDEMGFYVVEEAFDAWQNPKNDYDYARFFDQWQAKDIASMVRRDCNHPSIIMWSVGNEISDTHVSENGALITKMLKEEVESIDYLKHGVVTIGSNYMPWDNAQKCADELKFAGYNYGENYYDCHHEEHPDWFIYGSETSSIVASRGVYHFPYNVSLLADEDVQCSALGNSSTSWGARSIEKCINDDESRDFSLGQFVWSGFDYIGEPTPYHTKNSYFGQVDTAGFPKDSYYIFKAAWTPMEKECVLHLFPYWCFNKGQIIDVRVATNAPKVELFLNNTALGTAENNHWKVPYEPGCIKAVAYDENGKELASQSRYSFSDPVKLVAKEVSVHEHVAGTRDLAFVEIGCVDAAGQEVSTANNLVSVKLMGPGRVAGMDNGDSTDYQNYKSQAKRMFSGKLLLMVAVGDETGEIDVELSSPGLESARLTIPVSRKTEIPGLGCWLSEELSDMTSDEEIEPYRIELIQTDRNHIEAVLHPKTVNDAKHWGRLSFKAISDKGYGSPIAKVVSKGNHASFNAIADGQYRIRCTYSNEAGKTKLISELEQEASGLGKALVNPYELVPGSSYTRSEGNVTNGNEHGVATARDGKTVVCFDSVDFGNFGSNIIHLPVFELASEECPIEIWEGMAEEKGSEMLERIIYHKKSIWNTYQEEICILPRKIKGTTSVSFVLNQKIHLKGFYFDWLNKAFEELTLEDVTNVYGDSFIRTPDAITNIGNNVTIEFDDMDFGETGAGRVTICGRTSLEVQPIHINVICGEETSRQIVEFSASKDYKEMTFELKKISQTAKVQLIFMPGSNFDFKSLKFSS